MPGPTSTPIVQRQRAFARRFYRVYALGAGLALLFSAVGLAVATVACAGLRDASEIRLEVSLDRYELRVLENGRSQLRFDISTGMPSTPTPRGGFVLREVISNPSFAPGPEALARGGQPHAAAPDGPLGIAKIPFKGSFQIHAGEDPLALGKPMTLGCVGLTDTAMHELLDWLSDRGAIAEGEPSNEGQLHHRFLRPASLRIQ